MNNQYFSRIYFSRYFYSSFKSTLKTRIKITIVAQDYFYSDPYHCNKVIKNLPFKSSPFSTTSPVRSYFFPINFRLQESGHLYDLAWDSFSKNLNWRNKFFSLFIKLKLVNFFSFNFTKIYFNLIFKIFKS